ncbi:MAG: alcohol dehydrogenase catalytic domain-containing protein [Sphaerochaeta sp.]|nr:alcohol dehydrogenase catalytic domain-containing protein [Sphaerochaeta sp.]
MKAFKIESKGNVAFGSVEYETPKSDEIVVAVKVLGLCGSDLKTYHGDNPMVQYPIVPGHEIACEIVEIGSDVPSSLSLGDSGTIIPYTTCGTCPACRAKRYNTCSSNKTLGVARHGAARSFLTLNHKDFIACKGMDYTDIALIEPLSVGIHAANRAGEVNGKKVLLYGFGIVGVGIMLELKRKGAQVIVADISDSKLQLAIELGADIALDSRDPLFEETLVKFTNNQGFDVVIDAVGAGSIVTSALEKTAVAGTIVFVGYHFDTIPFNSKPIVSKELSVFGSRNALLADFMGAIDMLQKNPQLKDVLASKRFPFEEISEAFVYWDQNRGSVMKILIDLQEEDRGYE